MNLCMDETGESQTESSQETLKQIGRRSFSGQSPGKRRVKQDAQDCRHLTAHQAVFM